MIKKYETSIQIKKSSITNQLQTHTLHNDGPFSKIISPIHMLICYRVT